MRSESSKAKRACYTAYKKEQRAKIAAYNAARKEREKVYNEECQEEINDMKLVEDALRAERKAARIKATSRAYYLTHIEKVRAYGKQYRKDHKTNHD